MDRWLQSNERSQNETNNIVTNQPVPISTSANQSLPSTSNRQSRRNQTSTPATTTTTRSQRRQQKHPGHNLRQQSLHTIPRVDNKQPWGDSYTNKAPTDLRIAFRNVNSIPQRATDSRNTELQADINELQTDLYCAAETNIAFNLLPDIDLPRE
jgi:hypothetical protein